MQPVLTQDYWTARPKCEYWPRGPRNSTSDFPRCASIATDSFTVPERPLTKLVPTSSPRTPTPTPSHRLRSVATPSSEAVPSPLECGYCVNCYLLSFCIDLLYHLSYHWSVPSYSAAESTITLAGALGDVFIMVRCTPSFRENRCSLQLNLQQVNTLTTGAGSKVVLTGGVEPSTVFWILESTLTLYARVPRLLLFFRCLLYFPSAAPHLSSTALPWPEPPSPSALASSGSEPSVRFPSDLQPPLKKNLI